MLSLLFDIANCCSGIILGISVLNRWDGNHNIFSKLNNTLSPFATIIGGTSFVLGIYFLLRYGCAVHDIIAIIAGITLLYGTLPSIPAVGNYLDKAAEIIYPFRAAIGVAVLVIGILGLLNIRVLC